MVPVGGIARSRARSGVLGPIGVTASGAGLGTSWGTQWYSDSIAPYVVMEQSNGPELPHEGAGRGGGRGDDHRPRRVHRMGQLRVYADYRLPVGGGGRAQSTLPEIDDAYAVVLLAALADHPVGAGVAGDGDQQAQEREGVQQPPIDRAGAGRRGPDHAFHCDHAGGGGG